MMTTMDELFIHFNIMSAVTIHNKVRCAYSTATYRDSLNKVRLNSLQIRDNQLYEQDDSTATTQLPAKESLSPEPDDDSPEEEYPAAFKLAMIVVALVL